MQSACEPWDALSTFVPVSSQEVRQILQKIKRGMHHGEDIMQSQLPDSITQLLPSKQKV